MSASTDSSVTHVDVGSENEAPQLSALFVIRFDKKVGYTVTWKRSSIDVSLDGAVEYKSLPSGLHNVKSDLVYFVHEGYAGLSAFANEAASAAERNATFISVGILVPLSYGRLGRSWLHASRLQKIARTLAEDPSAVAPLEEFWDEQPKTRVSASTPKTDQPNGHSRERTLSTVTAIIPSDQSLPPFHPALSIIDYIDTFGPLVFRLQQAALLRKRILFVGAPPVRTTCEFVYDLSVLSSIPSSLNHLLAPGAEGLLRLRSLFSVGVHDITLLEKLGSLGNGGEISHENEVPSQGWVACTTDEIIATKSKLYDIIVEMPPSTDAPPAEKRWPTIKTSDGVPVKASQRDVSRYRLLHHQLWKYRHNSEEGEDENEIGELDDDQMALLAHPESNEVDEDFSEQYDEAGVESTTWSRLAYSGFMWWASAGETDAYMTKERERDREVLGDISNYEEGLHTAIIAYFHRATSVLINNLNSMIEGSDDENADDDDDDDEYALKISRDDISGVGLDTWSEADRAFVQEFIWMYFGRRAEIDGANLECCGIRIPIL
ncbi:hypothetical protein K504DRAFT_445856 [Pleomassaria siparia CBS 279.74]|uniref:DUF4484 domain-containing protein n=1 Tax=Pleomassaria siparia CBS 279.74 TaxID=1314801 RepID=A0A6G1KR30_9PLEO|nr:hypothetical protein K504DRAFT_445856 [Pleomassaria siparia CBS 279.74]